jgi:hypothetical protein
MKYQGVVGIGCFAKPQTLSRVLKKIVENYILGNLDGRLHEKGENCIQNDALKVIKMIIGGLAEGQHALEPEVIENYEKTSVTGVTGFFLACERQGLNLSIFTKEGLVKKNKYRVNY